MPELAKKITIDYENSTFHIDGAEFPWHITEQGPHIEDVIAGAEIPRVTVTMLTEDLEIIPKDN